MRYLLDSVIVIDHFNGINLATIFLSEQGKECALSVIARAEVVISDYATIGQSHPVAKVMHEHRDLFHCKSLLTRRAMSR